jgi:hypothetical protein
MRTLLTRISYLACYLSLGVMGFIATTYGESIATVRQMGVLGGDEMAIAYGAQCTQRGGADCTENQPICAQTGCKGATTCALGADGVTCYKIGAGGNQVTNCSGNQVGGNCCATCSSGCSNYMAGNAIRIGGVLTCTGSSCYQNNTCGTQTCGVYNCD